MIFTIYQRTLAVLMKKPLALWGISILASIITGATSSLFMGALGIALGINLLINTSMTMVYLHGYRGEGVKTEHLFDCFKDSNTMKRVLGGMLWMYLWTYIWLLVPIAGFVIVIIKSYEYRLTPYILITEPDVPITKAIKVSSKRTNGWKGKMFGADILIAVIIAAVILILAMLAAIPYIGGLFGIVLFIFVLCVLLLSNLYYGLIQAAFYEEITNPTPVPVRAPRPRYVEQPQAGTFCPHCGAPLPPNSNFCTNCGQRLG